MRYLLDTHIWLWLLESPTKIAVPVRTALEAADELVLSVASVWEIAIKVNLGKLVVRRGVEAARQEMLTAIGARELAITSAHALAGADLVTADEAVRQYSAPIQWAL
ncbi:MAG TPA: type II toxin-antitoxin system VapC family toxin [Polyangiaceae bacterium]